MQANQIKVVKLVCVNTKIKPRELNTNFILKYSEQPQENTRNKAKELLATYANNTL